jgi:hypothetical protein
LDAGFKAICTHQSKARRLEPADFVTTLTDARAAAVRYLERGANLICEEAFGHFPALGPLSGFVLVWAGFIGWGCFFHSGANNNALVKTIAGNSYGALVAGVALLIVVDVPVAGLGAVGPAIVGGVTVFFLVIVASIDLLSVAPANV